MLFCLSNTQYRVTAGIGTTAGLVFAGVGTTGPANPNVTPYVSGFAGEGLWNPGFVYQTGDVVAYQGTSYVAITTTTAAVVPPTVLSTEWNVLAEGFNAVGIQTYQSGSTYYKGQLATVGGNTYQLVATSAEDVHPTKGLTVGVGTTVVGVAVTAWELFNTGLRYDWYIFNHNRILQK